MSLAISPVENIAKEIQREIILSFLKGVYNDNQLIAELRDHLAYGNIRTVEPFIKKVLED